MISMDTIMRSTPVIPVLIIEDVRIAQPLAEALVAGGIHTFEVTLRTSAALEAIREMTAVEGAIVGVGTVLNEHDLEVSMEVGATFAVSPGLTESLCYAACESDLPFLPGVANAGDIMRGLEFGLNYFKFFPAEASGGIKMLQTLAAPFSQCRFCPTGGVTQANATHWLELDAVLCVGGSWLQTNPFDANEVFHRAQLASALSRKHQANLP